MLTYIKKTKKKSHKKKKRHPKKTLNHTNNLSKQENPSQINKKQKKHQQTEGGTYCNAEPISI